jgi:AMMECR1 domain-containing protein
MTAPKRITEIWAWVVTHENGDEGIPAASGIMEGIFLPLLGADEARVRSLEQLARAMAKAAGLPLKLMRFTQGEEVTP